MAPSLRVAEREGLGVCGGRRGVGKFGIRFALLWLSASDIECVTGLAGLLFFGFSHVRPSMGTVTTVSDGIQGPESS